MLNVLVSLYERDLLKSSQWSAHTRIFYPECDCDRSNRANFRAEWESAESCSGLKSEPICEDCAKSLSRIHEVPIEYLSETGLYPINSSP